MLTCELGRIEDYKREFGDTPFGLLIRKIAKLDHDSAMQAFSAMEPAKQRAIIDRTHTIGSKKEMQAFVSRIGRGETV